MRGTACNAKEKTEPCRVQFFLSCCPRFFKAWKVAHVSSKKLRDEIKPQSSKSIKIHFRTQQKNINSSNHEKIKQTKIKQDKFQPFKP